MQSAQAKPRFSRAAHVKSGRLSRLLYFLAAPGGPFPSLYLVREHAAHLSAPERVQLLEFRGHLHITCAPDVHKLLRMLRRRPHAAAVFVHSAHAEKIKGVREEEHRTRGIYGARIVVV